MVKNRLKQRRIVSKKPIGLRHALFFIVVVCLVVFSSSLVSAFDWGNGIVSYYKLDEASGTVIDTVGTNNGINYGATPNVAGKINTAYDFDGSNDWINVSDSASLQITGSLTMSAWVKIPSAQPSSYPAIAIKGGSGTTTDCYAMALEDGVDTYRMILRTGTTTSYLVSTSNVKDNTWHFLTTTYDGVNMKIYVDGVLENTLAKTGLVNTNTQDLLFGRADIARAYYLDGIIDEIGIWSRALTSTEVTQLYNGGDGITYTTIPQITLNSPADAVSFEPDAEIIFNATIPVNIPTNVSIYFNNTLNETNTSGVLGDYIFTNSFSSGEHNWTIEACNSFGCDNETRSFDISTIPHITILSPLNQTYNTSIYFNATSSISTTSNWTVNYNGTNFTLPNINYLIDVEDGSFNLLLYAQNNVTNEWGLNDLIYFSVDKTIPLLQVDSPNETFNYMYPNYNLTLNFTATDTNLDTCRYEYNGTNNIINCSTGVLNSTTFNYQKDKNNLTVYVNDTHGNQVSETVSWRYKVFENNRTLNTSSYETQSETFKIDISDGANLTAVTLDYNGTEYVTTKLGNVWSKTFDIPSSRIANNSVRWKFTYAGDNFYSNYSYQDISAINFSICGGSLTDDFLNISFKDEASLDYINASIPTSTFTYYLGSGTVTKEYQYENTDVHYYSNFCATPDLIFNVDSYVQYKQGTDYPQRIYDPDVMTYTSTVTNKILYLLNTIDGNDVTFQVINSAEQGISGVEISGTREISGDTVEVANGLTDAAGSVTFWLNPDFQHIFTLTKTGYETVIYTVTPTQPTYTVTMGGGVPSETDCTRGVSYTITPSNNFLDQNTLYDFSFNMDSSYWALTLFNASLYYGNNTLIDSDSSTTQEGGTLTFNDINTTNQTQIYLKYAYEVNDTVCISTSTNWIVQSIDGRGYSLWNLFTQTDEYLEADLYGVKGDAGNSDFGRIVIVFLIIVLVTGVTIQQFGIQSEPAIMSIIFGLVAILDVGLNFIPTIQIGGISVESGILTGITFLMWIAFLIRDR